MNCPTGDHGGVMGATTLCPRQQHGRIRIRAGRPTSLSGFMVLSCIWNTISTQDAVSFDFSWSCS